MRFSTLILLAGSVTAAFASPTANCKSKKTSRCITYAEAHNVAFLYGQTVGNFSLAVADEVL
jgi:hypothetical protein